MEIIDPFYLYLILQLDSIKGLLGGVGAVATIVGVIGGVFATVFWDIAAGDVDSWPESERRASTFKRATKVRNLLYKTIAVGALSCGINAFLPTSERMAILVVLPAVANNETVQSEAKEVYDLAKRGLTKLIEEPAAKPEENP